MIKKIIIVLLVLAVVALGVFKFLYKEHRDIASEESSFSETPTQIYDAFQKNDSLANSKYLDKTIEIYGKITNIDLANKTIMVDGKLSAKCTNSIPVNLKPQNAITLKGRVVGYDDLLGEIQMDQCTIKH